MAQLIGLDPTSGPVDRSEDRTHPPRPSSLSGAVIGLVANGLGRGELFLDALYEELAANDDVAGSVKVLKRSVSIPPDPDDWDRLKSEVTVAITGFGG